VIAGAALRAGEAAGDARDQRFFVDGEFDDVVEGAAAFGKQQLERFRLGFGSRDACSRAACVPLPAPGGPNRMMFCIMRPSIRGFDRLSRYSG
jgi:hypothetical protein